MKQIITLLLIFAGLSSFAQPPQDGKMRDKIKAQKVAFITEKLELTTDEAQKFWPIYNQFDDTSNKIKSDYFRPIMRKMRRNQDVSDSEANSFLEQIIEGENRMHQAKQKLLKDLKSAIPSKKIIRLKVVEDQFNKYLIKQLDKFRKNRKKD
ncbi:sensor of ECF-type sigma factor [uncultured Winogradskyella sp.]|uniref:sensor of ECF-type sigma factor n=1 Tax=uncultured Winogradskyella sp. TaxID=395353 RepID=UPI00260E2309|nr:sensor of ECF-type sigma factor [uncultured Winogradskyella sp.]